MKLPLNLIVTLVISGLQFFAVQGDLITDPKTVKLMIALAAFGNMAVTMIAQYSPPPGSVAIKLPSWLANWFVSLLLLALGATIYAGHFRAPASSLRPAAVSEVI